jgi:hypothetical protein
VGAARKSKREESHLGLYKFEFEFSRAAPLSSACAREVCYTCLGFWPRALPNGAFELCLRPGGMLHVPGFLAGGARRTAAADRSHLALSEGSLLC